MMKRPIYLWGLLFLLLAVVPAMADSISPTSFSATLAVGGTATVHKTVTVDAGSPTTSKVDVYFLADTTGSMFGEIAAVQAGAATILASTAGLGDVQFAVGEYKDFGDSYVYRLNQAMTGSQAAAQAGINLWGASGGGDTPEAELFALNTIATDPGTGWRAGSERVLVWMGDAWGHDPSGGVTEAIATAALVANGIAVEAADVGSLNALGQASRIAAATGGHYYSGLNTGTIVAAIQAAITTAFTTYTTVGLDLSEVPLGVTATAAPASYLGAFDRSIARSFAFDVTFTGDATGTYGFNIYATVDGGRVATEADRIVVGAVPEPGSILLFGTFLVGVAGVMRRRLR